VQRASYLAYEQTLSGRQQPAAASKGIVPGTGGRVNVEKHQKACEAAALAAVIVSPSYYNPVRPSRRIRRSIAVTEARMQKYSYYKN
jgi:hypothetical protein